MYEQQIPQTLGKHVKVLFLFLKGPQVFASITLWFSQPVRRSRISVLFSKVCFFIGTSEAGEVILSWLGMRQPY